MTRMLIKRRQRKKQTQRQRQRQTKPVDFEEQAIEHQQKQKRDRNRSTRRSIHVLVWRSLWHLHCSDSLLFLGVLACSGLVACRVVVLKNVCKNSRSTRVTSSLVLDGMLASTVPSGPAMLCQLSFFRAPLYIFAHVRADTHNHAQAFSHAFDSALTVP